MNCKPTTMILDAVLSNRRGEEVRRFHIERTFAFSGKLHVACLDNEMTNPGAIDELVRELYKEMKTDSTLANIYPPIKLPQ